MAKYQVYMVREMQQQAIFVVEADDEDAAVKEAYLAHARGDQESDWEDIGIVLPMYEVDTREVSDA